MILTKDKLPELLLPESLLSSEISLRCKFKLSPEIAYFKYLEASRPMMVLSSNTVLSYVYVLPFKFGGITLGNFETLVSDGMISMYQIRSLREASSKHTVWLRYRAVVTLKVRRIVLRFEKSVLAFDKAQGNNIAI